MIERAVLERPGAAFGTLEQPGRLGAAYAGAQAVARQLRDVGLGRGSIVAFIGRTSASYLTAWMGAQCAGVQAALINPSYPNELLREMLGDLGPAAILWVGREPGDLLDFPVRQFDGGDADAGALRSLRTGPNDSTVLAGQGRDCAHTDIACYMHTSGTSGRPKFCALSHDYFLRLGRFMADTMGLSHLDTVLAPLPMFHINPLGYGLLGALTAGAGVLAAERFSASGFWPAVKSNRVTALVLHLPPAAILKAGTTRDDARGHRVRVAFGCDPSFLAQFDVPIGVGGYGSTEAGGLCHSWHYRPHDEAMAKEGGFHYAGRARHDIEWSIAPNEEIVVREKRPHALLSGYLRAGALASAVDDEGWFHTGDRGRRDDWGNLVFIERLSESIRVKGEYVPIDFVEERLRRIEALGDFALWGREAAISGQEVVIYATGSEVPAAEMGKVTGDLPGFMRPAAVICVAELPRDSGVGKIQRRLLPQLAVRHEVSLED
ncbi:MAG: class I adenylate-forming enzyme family protein [Methylibium sp.]